MPWTLLGPLHSHKFSHGWYFQTYVTKMRSNLNIFFPMKNLEFHAVFFCPQWMEAGQQMVPRCLRTRCFTSFCEKPSSHMWKIWSQFRLCGVCHPLQSDVTAFTMTRWVSQITRKCFHSGIQHMFWGPSLGRGTITPWGVNNKVGDHTSQSNPSLYDPNEEVIFIFESHTISSCSRAAAPSTSSWDETGGWMTVTWSINSLQTAAESDKSWGNARTFQTASPV